MSRTTIAAENGFKRSGALTDAAWTTTNATITDNTTDLLAPDGTNTASLIAETTANGAHLTAQAPPAATTPMSLGMNLQVQIWVNSSTGTFSRRLLIFVTGGGSGDSYVLFNPRTGLMDLNGNTSKVAGQIVPDPIGRGASGWYLCTMNFFAPLATDVNTGTCTANFELDNGANGTGLQNTYVGSTTQGVYVWHPLFARCGMGRVPYVATAANAIAGNPRGLVF